MISTNLKYSIIIPTLNEEKTIEDNLIHLKGLIELYSDDVEIIVVDGGSIDGTLGICKKYNVKIITTEKSRGKQLSEGAKSAEGDVLIFLHADLKLPANTFNFLDMNFTVDLKAAAFRMRLDCNKMLYKVYSFFTRYDTIFTTFGDQGLIVRKDFYKEIGGYNLLPIMEDLDFCRRVRKVTKIKKINNYITTSSRRFEEVGVIKTQIRSLVLIMKYLFGVNPEKIYELYYK
jgi:rSAM/selenodomain-associated transferase 2